MITFGKAIWSVFALDSDSPVAATGPALIRFAAGLFIAGFHGWHKLVQGVAYLQQGTHWPLLDDVLAINTPWPILAAFAATATQFLGGIAVAVGFLTRPAAIAVTGSLFVAIYANLVMHKDNQLAMLYAVVFGGFALYGGGPYAIDALLFRPTR